MREEKIISHVYSFKRVLLSKKSYARIFARKDEDLYQLLMLCFDHKIETIKCNPGEETKHIIKKPYIKFRLNTPNEKYVYNIINQLDKENTVITFSLNHIGQKAITIKSLRNDKRIFKEIYDVILKDVTKEDPEIMVVYKFILGLKGINTNIKLICDDGKIRYYVNTTDDDILFDLEKNLFPTLEKQRMSLNLFK